LDTRNASIALAVIGGFCTLLILSALCGITAPTVYGQADPTPITYTTYLPLLLTSPSLPDSALIIDHTCTDISQIPDEWITAAKSLTFHFAHTSHGGQILSGLQALETANPNYAFSIRTSDPPALPSGPGLRIYDGNNYSGNNYITPEMYWYTADGRSHTRSVANTGLFNLSMWSWCGQLSYYSSTQVDEYTSTLAQYETDYPTMRFIYMTGHADGDPGSDLLTNNQRIRDYVSSDGAVLFDFWDIDSYDPDGTYHASNSEGQCLWCDSWCTAHPSDCTSLPASCAHSEGTQAQKLTCKLKAQAFWWMMARLAGWPGP
jgi:hypothetical protein